MPDVFGFINGMANIGSNWLSSIYGNQEAKEREEAARQQNYYLGEQAAGNADYRTRELYRDLYSPKAQMAQIKEAGLSPSIFYGDMAGMSGQTGAQGTGAAGISPSVFGLNPVDFAQINALNAEANLKNAQADTEKGENERGSAEIKSIIESTNNTMLKNVYQEYENALAEINVTIEASLQEEKIKNYIEQTKYLMHITRSAKSKADIDEASKQDVISYLHERTLNLAADTILKEAQKMLTDKQVQLTQQQIKDLISQITTREGQLDLDKEKLTAQINQWTEENGFTEKGLSQNMLNIIWNNANGTIGELVDLIPLINAAGAAGKVKPKK